MLYLPRSKKMRQGEKVKRHQLSKKKTINPITKSNTH